MIKLKSVREGLIYLEDKSKEFQLQELFMQMLIFI